ALTCPVDRPPTVSSSRSGPASRTARTNSSNSTRDSRSSSGTVRRSASTSPTETPPAETRSKCGIAPSPTLATPTSSGSAPAFELNEYDTAPLCKSLHHILEFITIGHS
ncbi:hypothetical protein DFH06DRAFT_1069494, partial [Mycena polygramma]